MNTAFIGLGSNLGDSLRVVLEGWEALGRVQGVYLEQLSHPYRTEPVGMASDNWFINAAGEVRTELSPGELLASLHSVEEQFGRRRDPAATGYQDRILDFDLLLYEQLVIQDRRVVVPHPALQDRLFVLLPLCEIAADIQHPVVGKNICSLLSELVDSGGNPEVEKTDWPDISG